MKFQESLSFIRNSVRKKLRKLISNKLKTFVAYDIMPIPCSYELSPHLIIHIRLNLFRQKTGTARATTTMKFQVAFHTKQTDVMDHVGKQHLRVL